MAIDVSSLFYDALLSLLDEKPLSKITISDLQKKTNASKQTFYNYFTDKQDLIQCIYLDRIIYNFKSPTTESNYHSALTKVFEVYPKYQKFLKQAILLDGQNSLRDFMIDYCIDYDLKLHQKFYGSEKMPEDLNLASKYNSLASMYMTISWILSDMPTPGSKVAEIISAMRNSSISPYLRGQSPYSHE